MKELVQLLVILPVILSQISCSSGRSFRAPDHGSLELGQTTEQQVVGLLGSPTENLIATANGEDLRILQYHYVSGGRNVSTGISPAKTMFFYLWKDRLVRYERSSTESGTSTDFDTALVEEITEGTTTRDEVIALLGEPGGYAVFPGIPERDVTAMIYFCEITTGTILGADLHRKTLILPFDDSDVIIDIQLTEIGKPKS